MSFWTTGHEEVLRDIGHMGAKAVSDEILERFGVYHSPHAVEMYAHRVHVSLRKKWACPECGLLVDHLNRQTGLCTRCSEVRHVEEERAYNELLEREAREAKAEEEDARREYAMLRQRNSRLRRKHDLGSKRDYLG